MKEKTEEWIRFEKLEQEHLARMFASKPKEEDYDTIKEFGDALGKWNKEYSMEYPNKPGYYRANND